MGTTARRINIADRNLDTDIIAYAQPIYYYTSDFTKNYSIYDDGTLTQTLPPDGTAEGDLIIGGTPYATGLSTADPDLFAATINTMRDNWDTLADWEIMIAGIESFNRGQKTNGALLYQGAVIRFFSAQALLDTEALDEDENDEWPDSMMILLMLKEPSMGTIMRYLIATREDPATINLLDATIKEAEHVYSQILEQGTRHLIASTLLNQGYPLIDESHWPAVLDDKIVSAAQNMKEFVLTYTPE